MPGDGRKQALHGTGRHSQPVGQSRSQERIADDGNRTGYNGPVPLADPGTVRISGDDLARLVNAGRSPNEIIGENEHGREV